MSYTPNTWTTGDTITAAKLNNIEQGIANAGGVLICTSSYDGDLDKYVLDKTAQEIYEAFTGGTPVYIKAQYGTIDDYIGNTFMCPLVWISNYNYTGNIRFFASKADLNGGSVDGEYGTGKPSVTVYEAESLNEYPKHWFTTTVNDSNMVEGSVSD